MVFPEGPGLWHSRSECPLPSPSPSIETVLQDARTWPGGTCTTRRQLAPQAWLVPQTPVGSADSCLCPSLVRSTRLVVSNLPNHRPTGPSRCLQPQDSCAGLETSRTPWPALPVTGQPAGLFIGAAGGLQAAYRKRCLEKEEGFEAQGEPARLWFTFFALILTSISAP